MKKINILIATILFTVSSLMAQIPEAINFQAIARDVSGNVMANTNIQIRLTIIDSVSGGTEVYQELRALTTNAYGSFSFQIGQNANYVTIGAFNNIQWETGSKYLKIDYDPTNTFTWTLTLGTIQLVSVPYAMSAGSVTYIDLTGINDGDVLVYNSTTQKFEPGQVAGGNVEWVNVQNKPNFATVATTGNYLDLSNQPDLTIYSTTDTTLNEAEVDAFVSNNGYLTVEVDASITNEIELPSGGTNGQVLKTDGSGNYTWIDQTIQLDETQVDNYVSNNGYLTQIIEVADEFTATASQTSFTLSNAPAVNSKVIMFINGIRISNTAYSVSGTTLTYNSANNGTYNLEVGDRIQFDYYY